MAINEQATAFVATTAAAISLSQIFAVTAAASNPAYLVLTALDRNEYTTGASGATGSFSGNGHTLGFTGTGGDARGAGIVFTYVAATGRYYNATYGYFDQLGYNASSSLSDVTNLSLFGTNDLGMATAYAADVYTLMQTDATGYLGSATVVTQPAFTGVVPLQATPASIVAIADSFVGKAWNMNGCWVLTSTIAAEAGASLPVQSTMIGQPGQSNGEWFAVFNGPGGQSGNWQSMVRPGEMVVIGTPGGGGHITTCVSGSGSSAMLVDNITYVNGAGQILNAANDGSSSDIVIAAPHAASQEWSGVQASSVVIYELDTPIVTANVTSDSLSFLGSQALMPLFTAMDPAGNAVAGWQVYDTALNDALVVNGSAMQDHSATSALGAASLAGVFLLAGSTSTTDTLEVRAFNGKYWGDWASLAVSIVAAAPAAPVLVAQTAAQIWKGGSLISLTLPSNSFIDPQGQSLRYSASLANGGALPNWLSFNSLTRTFIGFAPTTQQAMGLVVTATDTSGLSATESFSATVLGVPVLAVVTPTQTWTGGAILSLALPANSFVDPQGQRLTYSATQSNGQALPAWLSFNPTTQTFNGTAPSTSQSLNITVTATDTSGMSGSETFVANVKPAAPAVRFGVGLTTQTPDQSWTGGQAVDLVLPSNTFTDALGLNLTFTAYEASGLDVTSWLHFNRATDEFYGVVPNTASGTARIEVIASDRFNLSATDLFSVTLGPAAGHSTIISTTTPRGSMGFVALPQPEAITPSHH